MPDAFCRPCDSADPAPPPGSAPAGACLPPPFPAAGDSAATGSERGARFPVYLVEPDREARIATARGLTAAGFETRPFASEADLAAALPELAPGCVVIGLAAVAPGAPELCDGDGAGGFRFPTILHFSTLSIREAVAAVRLGAADLLAGPVKLADLVEALGRAAPKVRALGRHLSALRARAAIATLRPRELLVLDCIMKGLTNKEMARDFGISPRTVEMHRTRLHRRLRVASLAELLALAWHARSVG